MSGIQHLLGPYLTILACGALVVTVVALGVNAWNFYLRFKFLKLDRPHCPTPSATQPPR
ncbi:MAG TPA: hypothetical protein VJV74_08615 [Terriglobia bacterium]|nr:hypothetical protein [Terriglobia bacterium]